MTHSPANDWAWFLCPVIFCGLVTAGMVSGNVYAAATSGLSIAVALAAAVRAVAAERRKKLSLRDFATVGQITRSGPRVWGPLWIAMGWLLGTYGAFRLTGLSEKVTDNWTLTMFVLAVTGAFGLGYVIRVKSYPAVLVADDRIRSNDTVAANRLVFISGLYFIALGLTSLTEYGATSVGGVLARIQEPGSSYMAKFGVYAEQEATSRVSVAIQILTLAGCLYGVLCPMLAVHWRSLTLVVRMTGLSGILMYAIYFLFIGTQKGLGDIVVMLMAGIFSGAFGTWWARKGKDASTTGKKAKVIRYAVLVTVAFMFYMVSAQAQRAEQFGTRDVTPPNATVAALVGDHTATGISAALFYPTHGYLGLSYNLGTPFEWTGGLGASPVIASYANQYLGAPAPRTYPVRTESRTGWPAGRFWATAYPWLASDFTWPGTIVLMGLFGWLFARMWIEGAIRRDTLALVIFGQLSIAVAYIPANNQIWVSRPTAIGFVTLMILYVARSIFSNNAGKQSLGAKPSKIPAKL